MKVFKFELTITDEDVNGDEFWENALERDGTGILTLKEAIVEALEDSNLFVSSENRPIDIVKLISYTDNK
jgi:hypothetical protein